MYALLLPPPQLGYGRFLPSKFITCQFVVNLTLSHSKKPLTVLLSVTVDQCVSFRISFKWNYRVCVLFVFDSLFGIMSNSPMLSSNVLMMDICVLPNLVIINKISVYIYECEQVFVWTNVFISFKFFQIPSSNIAGSYGKWVVNFLRNTNLFSKVWIPFYIPKINK